LADVFGDGAAETVVERIYYVNNAAWDYKLREGELRRGDFVATLYSLDDEEDINKVLQYFSYEHFYVMYCKFWELDTDHDTKISKEELLRYSNYALTEKIIDRVMTGAPKPLTCATAGKFGYRDWICARRCGGGVLIVAGFIMSEEDKNTESAKKYWFKCLDTDGDGVLSLFEMAGFYSEQLQRMQAMSQEVVALEDVVCQL
jgi:serine/threonine-protein phosphatase 2A regulatory subunit B''